ncbi:hypothetical protein SADUNF_Sadunf02G0172900 [Salix dunnii]|uniref:Uncharacterized protein n=1 Tax=Salix dunnii TaxID=1413687 RepID=A0A835N8I6_9ROSI|nr:hypothetical protein SADUNF_Sadunf02G0172900 [Salix dunnii]
MTGEEKGLKPVVMAFDKIAVLLFLVDDNWLRPREVGGVDQSLDDFQLTRVSDTINGADIQLSLQTFRFLRSPSEGRSRWGEAMALVICWYDIVCLGLVAASLVVSFWVLWRRELASKCDDNIIYQSLLVARPDINDRTVVAMPGNHVGSSQLWTSCWKAVHPGWLLATRFISFLVMAGLLWRDIVEWDATIFIYYTEFFALLCLSPMLYRIVSLDGAFAFYFYTQWTFMLIMIYFALGTVMSAYGCWVSFKQPAVSEHGEKSVFLKRDVEEDGTATSITYKENKSEGTVKLRSHCAEEAIRERAGFWGYLMQIIYQLMGCMHSLNAVFLVIDTALNSLCLKLVKSILFRQYLRLLENQIGEGNDLMAWCLCHPIRLSFAVKQTSLDHLCGDSPFVLVFLSAISLVPPCIFCSVELPLCHFPVGYSCMWFYVVAISIPRAQHTLGSSMVFCDGCNSHSLLWDICTDF